jgi:hypothetical protein
LAATMAGLIVTDLVQLSVMYIPTRRSANYIRSMTAMSDNDASAKHMPRYAYLEHVVSQTDDDELSILGAFLNCAGTSPSVDVIMCTNCHLITNLNVVTNNRNVSEIKGGIDLVHHVKWRRFVMVKCEYKRQRRKSFLQFKNKCDEEQQSTKLSIVASYYTTCWYKCNMQRTSPPERLEIFFQLFL